MREIPLTQGKVALIDDEDFDRVNQFKWCAFLDSRKTGRWYAQRGIKLDGNWTTQLMHRFILEIERGDPRQCDHKDRLNTLDNRRNNLRVTLNQNQQNVGKYKNNTSGFKGVYWSTRDKKWEAQIKVNGENIYLGLFPTAELAALAYDEAALPYHGEFAVTNEMLGLLKKPVESVIRPMQVAA